MSISFYWGVLALFILAVAVMLWAKFANRQNMVMQPSRKPLDTEPDQQGAPVDEDSSTVSGAAVNHDDNPPENRKLDTTRNYIPLENIVVSEVPISKAVTIGHLEAKEKESQDTKSKS